MTTKTITPQEVTPEMLVAGVESNETLTNLPARFQLVNGEIRYSVKFPTNHQYIDGKILCSLQPDDKWEWVDTVAFAEIQEWMEADSTEETIWTTTVEQETPHD